ncbi:MAG TPA: carbohydrate ABC transporter permease [Clostridiales bacterium]|nr:carbohydrate ABC transporter permease [Clostridiales bacterium]
MTKKKRNISMFNIINTTGFILLGFIFAYPFYYLIIYSLSNSTEAARSTPWLLPRGLTMANYMYLFKRGDIIKAFLVSLSRTVLGTAITVFCSAMFAYLLTQRKLAMRRFIYFILVITMYLNAGIIPYFIIMRSYGLNNNFLLYILPSAIGAFYVILIKTYIESIPPALEEAAKIDGAGYFTVFIRVIMPICLPILATIAIFSAVNQWNTWQDNFYLVKDRDLKTLQLLLLEYLQSMDSTLISDINTALQKTQRTSSLSLKACISVVTMLPVMVVYPLFQRYFVKGIMIGSVKG